MLELLRNGQTNFSRDQYRVLPAMSEEIAVHGSLEELFEKFSRWLLRIVSLDFINLVAHIPMRPHLLVTPEPTTISPGLELSVDESPDGLVWATQQPLPCPIHEKMSSRALPASATRNRSNE